MSDLAEMSHMVNAASAAFSKLEGDRGGKAIRHKLIRSIYAVINEASLRVASLAAIAERISASTGMKLSELSLYYLPAKLTKEEIMAAMAISRNLAEKTAAPKNKK